MCRNPVEFNEAGAEREGRQREMRLEMQTEPDFGGLLILC